MHTPLKLQHLLIPLVLFSFGCTSTNPIQPIPTQPLTDGATGIRAEAGPITVVPPQGYLVENGRDGVSLSGTGDEGTMLIGLRISDSSGQTADRLIETYMLDLPSGWNRLIDSEEISGISGRGSRYSLEDESGLLLTGRVIALTTAERDYLIFAVMGQEDWILGGSSDFSAMISTLEIDDTATTQVNLPAIDGKTENESDPGPKPTPSPTQVPPALGIPPFNGQSANGYACFSGFETGLNCILPSGRWAHFSEENSALASNSIFAMTSCPDGRILMADVRRITLFDGVEFISIEPPEDISLPDLIGCGPNGEIWIDEFEGISLFRDNKWEFFEKSEIVKDTETVFQGLEIAPDGTAWVMAFNEVASLAPGRSDWTIYAEGQGLNDKYFFDAITLDQDGSPYLSHSSGYIWREGDQWRTREGDFGLFGDIEVAIDQRVYQTSFSEGLAVYDQDSISNQTMEDGLSRNKVDLVESDNQGRIWVTTETGIDIFDGQAWTQLRMDNSELVNNRFRDIVIIGNGPSLPQTDQKPMGELVGQLVNTADQPLANTTVALCFNGYISYSEPIENPCLDSVESYTEQTDSTGLFHIKDVPSGRYELFFIVDGVWQELQNEDRFLAERILIEPSQTTDLGLRQAEPND
ncbi:MAG: hypothetical protein AB8G95_04105 [Anaerolineae bacterium]